jgi:hypothetical protein
VFGNNPIPQQGLFGGAIFFATLDKVPPAGRISPLQFLQCININYIMRLMVSDDKFEALVLILT